MRRLIAKISRTNVEHACRGVRSVLGFALLLFFFCVPYMGFAEGPITSSRQLENLLKKNPSKLSIREKLGALYFKEKKYEDTIKTLAPFSNDISEDAVFLLAEAYEKNGDPINRIRILLMA